MSVLSTWISVLAKSCDQNSLISDELPRTFTKTILRTY